VRTVADLLLLHKRCVFQSSLWKFERR